MLCSSMFPYFDTIFGPSSFFLADGVFQADWLSSPTKTIGYSIMETGLSGMLNFLPSGLMFSNSLKWHYEVFRWIDQFIGNKSEV